MSRRFMANAASTLRGSSLTADATCAMSVAAAKAGSSKAGSGNDAELSISGEANIACSVSATQAIDACGDGTVANAVPLVKSAAKKPAAAVSRWNDIAGESPWAKSAALVVAALKEARPYQSARWILVNRCCGVELAYF